MQVGTYQEEVTKIHNSIQAISKNQTPFLGIVKFIIVQRRKAEYQLNLLQFALQKLRQRDFTTSSTLFKKQQVIISLIKLCCNLQTLGLILKQHHLFLDKDTYDFGTPILQATYNQLKLIASQTQQYDCFMVVPIDDFGRTKRNDPSKYWNKLNEQSKLAYQARIFIMIEFIVAPLVQYYSTMRESVLEDLRIVIKWLFFVADSGDAHKLALITQLARKVLPKICSPLSKVNNNLMYCFNVIMRVLALPLYEQEIVKPMNNLGLFLMDIPEIVIDKLCIEWFKSIKIGDLPKQGFVNITNNLLDCMTQFQSLKIILALSKQLNNSNNTQSLAYIYDLVVKRKLLQKLYIAPNSWKIAIDILLYYIVGFVNSDRIGQQLQQLVINYSDLLEQSHLQQIMTNSTDMVSASLNVLCFKNTSVKPLVFLLEICQYRFKSLTHKTQTILNQLKQRYEIQIDFYDMEKYIKGNMFENNSFGGMSCINQHLLIPTKRYKGLQNIGNTCYMNSFLQVLFTTKRFNDIISQIGNPINEQHAKRPCFILHELFEELRIKPSDNMDPMVPYKFKKFMMQPFSSSKDQQDSAEFGRLYLEHILNDFSNQSFFSQKLQRLFFNRTVSQISCTRCKSRSNRQQKILDYILPFTSTINQQPQFISTLFKNYFMIQHLDQNNTMFCNKCQSQQQISTKIFPKQFSTIITLTLNRFLYDRVQQKKIKLLNPVALQLQIDIHDISPMASNCRYTLQSFIVHIGLSAQAGHYVAYSRNIEENPNLWYVFDDGYVSEREIYDVKDFNLGEYQTPYILFYNSEQSMMSSMHLRDSQASVMSSRISNK